ncbi:hypothetical protein ACOMHN_029858 [Nucella lapillus]
MLKNRITMLAHDDNENKNKKNKMKKKKNKKNNNMINKNNKNNKYNNKNKNNKYNNKNNKYNNKNNKYNNENSNMINKNNKYNNKNNKYNNKNNKYNNKNNKYNNKNNKYNNKNNKYNKYNNKNNKYNNKNNKKNKNKSNKNNTNNDNKNKNIKYNNKKHKNKNKKKNNNGKTSKPAHKSSVTTHLSSGSSHLSSGSAHLSVPPSIEADLGQGVTLPCRLQTEGRWYVISWARLHDNGSHSPLVSLPSGQMVRKGGSYGDDPEMFDTRSPPALSAVSVDLQVPDWSQEIPKSLRMRVYPLITMMADRKEFNLVLTSMTCADRGRYLCRAVTASGTYTGSVLLLMTQPPGRPRIVHRVAPWPLNHSQTLLCRAQAGFPPQEFHWYLKTPSMRHFQVVEGQGKVVYHHDPGCRVTSERALKVHVSGGMEGAVFRCALPGRVREAGLFEEVTVRLPPNAEKKMDSKSQASAMSSSLIGCWIVSLRFIGQFEYT